MASSRLGWRISRTKTVGHHRTGAGRGPTPSVDGIVVVIPPGGEFGVTGPVPVGYRDADATVTMSGLATAVISSRPHLLSAATKTFRNEMSQIGYRLTPGQSRQGGMVDLFANGPRRTGARLSLTSTSAFLPSDDGVVVRGYGGRAS